MNYQSFQKSHGLSNNDFIATVQAVYPKYSKIQHSMCCNPEKYGVRLVSAAEKLVKEKYTPRKPKRAKPNMVSARLDDETHARLMAFLKRYDLTQQDFLTELITKYWRFM